MIASVAGKQTQTVHIDIVFHACTGGLHSAEN